MMTRLVDYFWKGTDPRVYALMRAVLAFCAMVNLADLWPRRFMYFASTGMISQTAVRAATAGKYYESIFFFVSSEAGVTAVFLGAAVAIGALGVGFGTRVAAGLVWAWHVSYSDRAFPILHGWDAVLRSYSLLVLLSPTGRVWSLDHILRPRPDDADEVPMYGLRLMQWQLLVLYTTTVWLKVVDPFWRSGQVLLYFSMSQYSRNPDDLFFVHHEWVSAVGTYLTLAAEMSIPWLLWFRRTRALGMVAGFCMHLSIALTAHLGVFSTCMLVPYMAFLERPDVDWLVALSKVRSWKELRGFRVETSPPPSPPAERGRG